MTLLGAESRSEPMKAVINRLRLNSCYLVGAMSEVDDFGRSWREVADEELTKRGIIVLNPIDKPTTYAREDEDLRDKCYAWAQQGEYQKIANEMKTVRAVDLRMCDHTDFVIYMINDKRSWGSPEEVSLLNRQKKPVLCFCADGFQIKDFGPWMFGMLPHRYFFESWEECLTYIDEVAFGPDVPDDTRWCFFNHEQLIRKAWEGEWSIQNILCKP